MKTNRGDNPPNKVDRIHGNTQRRKDQRKRRQQLTHPAVSRGNLHGRVSKRRRDLLREVLHSSSKTRKEQKHKKKKINKKKTHFLIS